MDLLTRSDLNELMTEAVAPCVSIYVPTARERPRQYDTARIHLKNLLDAARTQLDQTQYEGVDIAAMLAPAQALQRSRAFWNEQARGLAVFITPNLVRHWRLPLDFEPAVHVGASFWVRPLLPYFDGDDTFYILALSRNDVRLLRATRHQVTVLPLPDTPTSLEEALRWDDPEKQLQMRTAAVAQDGSARGARVAFHGHSPSDEETSNLSRFVRHVDRGITDAIDDTTIPLVLAGTEEIVAAYRQVTDHSALLDSEILGAPDTQTPAALHAAAVPRMMQHLEAKRQVEVDRYGDLAAQNRATAELEKLVRAAYFGQIDVFFLPDVAPVYGTYDPEQARVTLTTADGAVDLLNAVAVQTLQNGGTVYTGVSPLEDRPAALLRYTTEALPGS